MYVSHADFDKDGNVDLVVGNGNSHNLSVLPGMGNGNFNAAVNYPISTSPNSMICADFNNDTNVDVALAGGAAPQVEVLLGTAGGGLSPGTFFSTSPGVDAISVCAGDFNLDGKTDLATANYTTHDVSVMLGNGTGSFGSASTFSVHLHPYDIIAGDFNSDGKPDLATANYSSNDLSILLNHDCSAFGVDENTQSLSISVHPNPANDQVTIDLAEKADVMLFDLQGSCVWREKVNRKTSLDVLDFGEGVYTLKIQTAGIVSSEKLVILHH